MIIFRRFVPMPNYLYLAYNNSNIFSTYPLLITMAHLHLYVPIEKFTDRLKNVQKNQFVNFHKITKFKKLKKFFEITSTVLLKKF